ncbi:L-asparaginase 2 [Anaerobiospirillum succiniciproducens]|uniref:L-asparaginase 2 n=1 Tax=Anaerobiospirillum succiniciproducens TaxID=13335 RepID=UPI00040513FC|nr:L-asparaginase 2 [Anaerobiospirillum succiniciproducens]MDO4676687.1 L-asparaginase 2 [Anaerobiospirillum succiniciproducens]
MIKRTLLAAALFVASSSAAMALPNVEVLATGGTIAGAGQSATDTAYTAGKVSVNHLVAAVPQLAEIANVIPKQVVQIGSQDMTDDVWLTLVKTINQDCNKVDGFVVTHGTDTMEETAYFVNLTAKCEKPIVFVGAMLPSTGLSADGPKNLYNAVVVASTKEAGGRGAMVAMDDKIISARDVIKTNTTSVETFQGANFGTMGYIFNSKVHFANTPDTPHTKDTPFDVSKLDKLPKVGIVYNYSNVPAEPLKALLDAGYEGIVTAGVGNGNIHKNLFPLLEKAAKDGVAVVRSSRVPTGSATKDAEIDDKKYGFVAGQFLNPQKARVLLQLALTKTKDPAKIQEYFDKY